MYRCAVCQALSRPGQARRVHVVQREVPGPCRVTSDGSSLLEARREVSREIPVCEVCAAKLSRGASVREMLAVHRPAAEAEGDVPTGPAPSPLNPKQLLLGRTVLRR